MLKIESQIFEATSGGAAQMCLDMNVPFLGKIPLDPLIGKCCDEGKSFIKEYPNSLAAIAYKSLLKGLSIFSLLISIYIVRAIRNVSIWLETNFYDKNTYLALVNIKKI